MNLETDLWGAEIDVRRDPITTAGGKRRKTRPNGYAAAPGSGPTGETCKNCAHFCRVGYHRKTYRKCALVKWTHGPGTDILARSLACGMWKAKGEEEK